MNLTGKTAVITGASRGIGSAVARALAARGCCLLLTAYEEDELRQLAQDLDGSAGGPTSWMACDLVDTQARRKLIDWIKSRDDEPDILVNNAGGGRFERFASSTWSDIEQTLILDAVAPTHLIHELLPLLRRRSEASIVNISSATARMPYPGLAVYGACKGYLSSLSESLTCELAGTGVRVLCIHPGFTRTHFMQTAGMDMQKIPGWFVKAPEAVAARIVRAIEKDRSWTYTDPATRIGTWLSTLIAHPVKTHLFRNLFWRLPDEA